MPGKNTLKSSIMQAVHETASDFHRRGFINIRKMREFDALCLTPIQDYTGEKIQALRKRYKLSQAVPNGFLDKLFPAGYIHDTYTNSVAQNRTISDLPD